MQHVPLVLPANRLTCRHRSQRKGCEGSSIDVFNPIVTIYTPRFVRVSFRLESPVGCFVIWEGTWEIQIVWGRKDRPVYICVDPHCYHSYEWIKLLREMNIDEWAKVSWVIAVIQHFPSLLNLYWILATGAATVSLIPIRFAQPFRDAVMLTACRGKLWEDRPRGKLGIFSDLAVPHCWFAHFYDVGAVVNASVMVAYVLHLLGSNSLLSLTSEQAGSLAALLLLQLHLTRRLLEANFMQRYPQGSKMHVIAYLFGLSYYTVLPLSVLPHPGKLDLLIWSQTAFNHASKIRSTPVLSLFSALTPLQALGCLIFLGGNLLQWHSHFTLARLGPGAQSRKTGGYAIPTGGGFLLVSSPHYLGEMVIYFGLVLVTGIHRLLPWIIFAWVVINLLLAAGPTHDWYRRTFPNYPRKRWAVIPGLY
eukprot:jgi/Botrbrau1/1215/Bobra.0163s0023.1